MATGAVVAVIGDALAQAGVKNDKYDLKRALSFATFDSVYRAAQHYMYPILFEIFKGQYLLSIAAILGFTISDESMFATFEQALASQLIVIPLVYYPVFFAVTGAVQGLSIDETVRRARDTFVPIMKRNLAFWIPIQFIVFTWVEEEVQIPLLTVLGLVWTIILSVFAGSAKVDVEKEDLSLDETEYYFLDTMGEDLIADEKRLSTKVVDGLPSLAKDEVILRYNELATDTKEF
eukprot:CAMPEP_0184862708 /NCGR_PEP_ID=MMETSP0580-20130426/7110_1 /TAXON_ID=1118495 /ORGANISM="Dactyliosolen fragilissimus" /LENGTH=233 /DNA_ID=CAMNT_0027360667 /DNA_START=306 /DNA_END=1007 /DNA_ORIENTATION=-